MNETTKNDIIVLPETDSTNTRLKELARQGTAHGTAILALRQSAGRGRFPADDLHNGNRGSRPASEG